MRVHASVRQLTTDNWVTGLGNFVNIRDFMDGISLWGTTHVFGADQFPLVWLSRMDTLAWEVVVFGDTDSAKAWRACHQESVPMAQAMEMVQQHARAWADTEADE